MRLTIQARLQALLGIAALAAAALVVHAPRAGAQTTPATGGSWIGGSNMLFELTNGRASVRLDTLGRAVTIAHPWPLVYDAVLAALREAQVPVTFADTSAGVAGSTAFPVSRRLGRTSLAEYLDCGSSIAGPNANFMRGRMAVVVFARRVDATTTALRTAVVATGRSLDGASTGDLQCATTGKLEERLQWAISKRLANGD